MQTEFVISAGEQPKRLDVFLVHREPKLSRAALQRMITAGWVRVNSLIAKSSQRIKAGDVIVFDAPQAAPLRIDGETKQLEILFEDHGPPVPWTLVQHAAECITRPLRPRRCGGDARRGASFG